jgi:DNA-binding NarL/FixJ family response regulator
MTVAKDTSPRSTNPTPPRIPSADHLLDLLTSFSSLRQNNRTLVGQLRGSMREHRELRLALSDRPALNGLSAGRANPNGSLVLRFGFTRREEQVALLLAEGKSNQAIARELDISVHTARHHTQRILTKLEVHSRGEAGAKIRS